MQAIRSKDTAQTWPDALQWMNNEFSRLGWCRHKVFEDLETKTIYGMVSKITAEEECSAFPGKVLIDKSTTLKFEIRDFDGYGKPSVMMHKFGQTYRVYHEYEFDANPVAFLWKLLEAQNESEIIVWAASPRVFRSFEWFRASLNKEKKVYNAEGADADRCREIDRIRNLYSSK